MIIETDPSRAPNLVPIILHFANILGPRWPVVLLTLRARWAEPASPAFRRHAAAGRVRVDFLPEGTAFPSHAAVSLFLARPWLWERFQSAGRVLLFQADSVLCGASGRAVEDYLGWDFVGAPVAPAYGVGYNGGLSLRNPRLLLEVLRDPGNDFARDSGLGAVEGAVGGAGEGRGEVAAREEGGGQGQSQEKDKEKEEEKEQKEENNNPPPKPSWMKFEDQWFYMKLKERGAKLPDQDVARTFSVETVYYEKPLGYHQPFRWLNAQQKKQAMEWCPEIGMLQDGSHFFT